MLKGCNASKQLVSGAPTFHVCGLELEVCLAVGQLLLQLIQVLLLRPTPSFCFVQLHTVKYAMLYMCNLPFKPAILTTADN